MFFNFLLAMTMGFAANAETPTSCKARTFDTAKKEIQKEESFEVGINDVNGKSIDSFKVEAMIVVGELRLSIFDSKGVRVARAIGEVPSGADRDSLSVWHDTGRGQEVSIFCR